LEADEFLGTACDRNNYAIVEWSENRKKERDHSMVSIIEKGQAFLAPLRRSQFPGSADPTSLEKPSGDPA
jgi:hypothetical protein